MRDKLTVLHVSDLVSTEPDVLGRTNESGQGTFSSSPVLHKSTYV